MQPAWNPSDHEHCSDEPVSVDEVLWRYVLYDSALDGVRAQIDLDAPDSNRYKERVALLCQEKKPWPKNARELIWHYKLLSREMVETTHTPWKGRKNLPPSVGEVVRRMNHEPYEELANELGISPGSFDKIKKFAGFETCGNVPEYRTCVLLRNDREVSLVDGTHRLCAVWHRFGVGDLKWPGSLGGFIGQECNPKTAITNLRLRAARRPV